MKFEENEVYSFKMHSGEEMIATYLGMDGDELIIHNPVSVAPGPQGMGLIQSMFTSDTKSDPRLNNSSYSLVCKTDATITEKYVEATTGLVVPKKKFITG
jgi:hypothetical protein